MPKVSEPRCNKKQHSNGFWYFHGAYQGDERVETLGTREESEAEIVYIRKANAFRKKHGFLPLSASSPAQQRTSVLTPGPPIGYTVANAAAMFVAIGLDYNYRREAPRAPLTQKALRKTCENAICGDEELANIDLGVLTVGDVKLWAERRSKTEKRNRNRGEGTIQRPTISKNRSALTQVLNFASNFPGADGRENPIFGLLPQDFGEKIVPSGYSKKSKPRIRWLTHQEYVTFRDFLDAEPENQYVAGARKRHGTVNIRRSLWLTLGVYTGGRESELRELTWRDVEFTKYRVGDLNEFGRQQPLGFVTLTTAKTPAGEKRERRQIPFGVELRRLLEPLVAEPSDPVIPMAWQNPAGMLTRLARRAKLCGERETLNDNDMRRTFASWLLQAGNSKEAVAKLMGHGSTDMVDRVYGQLDKANLIDAAMTLPVFATPLPKEPEEALARQPHRARRRPSGKAGRATGG